MNCDASLAYEVRRSLSNLSVMTAPSTGHSHLMVPQNCSDIARVVSLLPTTTKRRQLHPWQDAMNTSPPMSRAGFCSMLKEKPDQMASMSGVRQTGVSNWHSRGHG